MNIGSVKYCKAPVCNGKHSNVINTAETAANAGVCIFCGLLGLLELLTCIRRVADRDVVTLFVHLKHHILV